MSPTTIEIEVNGHIRSVAVKRLESNPACFRVSWDDVVHLVDARQIDEETLSLVAVDGGSGSHQIRCIDTDQPGQFDVHVDGAVVRVRVDVGRTRSTDLTGRGSVTDGAQNVRAPMPGKVVRLLVKLGEEVAAGQAVIVLEAMKMENELSAPRAGRVAEIAVAESASVEAGKLLIVIE